MTNNINHHPMVNIAVKAARLAGKIIMRALDNVESIQVFEKGIHDYASNIDKAAENIIIDTIQRAYPHHSILGEEGGLISTTDHAEATWIIDPLDGTTNFLHGLPHFCISIAVSQQDQIIHGVVYDPCRDELFVATRGRGVQMNGRRLRVSGQEKLSQALLGTGIPFREFEVVEQYLNYLRALIPSCAGIRRGGSAALDLAYVAAGRLDGFWEYGLKPWDVAAGSLFVQEAGGWITTIDGDEDFLNGKSILAGAPKIYQQMQNIMEKKG